jgi:DNA-binding HxlR family transcriptional regulator
MNEVHTLPSPDGRPPGSRALGMLGDRWSLLIIYEVLLGHRRFGQIQRSLGLARTVLTSKLTLLVERDLLRRRRYHTDPDWYEYYATPRGRALRPVIAELLRWEAAQFEEIEGERMPQGDAHPRSA